MSLQSVSAEVARARKLLHGFPEATLSLAENYFTTRKSELLDSLVIALLVYHLPANPEGKPDVAAMPRSTQLVQELAFDSLSAVEMSFLLQDLFAVQIPDKDLIDLKTVEDLIQLVSNRVKSA